MNAAEQRIMALVLTDARERERRLERDGLVFGIDARAIRRFAQSISRRQARAVEARPHGIAALVACAARTIRRRIVTTWQAARP